MSESTNKTYLSNIGTVAVLLGIALESAYVLIPWPGRAELAHLFGFAGLTMYFAGIVIGAKQFRIGWQPLGGLCAVALFVCLPSYVARQWLDHHGFRYFIGAGHAIAPQLLVCALALAIVKFNVWYDARILKRGDKPSKPITTHYVYGAFALILQCLSFWYELYQQPFVTIGGHLPARGHIEWGQVICDAIGIALGFWISKMCDPTSQSDKMNVVMAR